MDENVPELRFPEFDGEWEYKKLSDVCSIQMGQSPSSTNYTENPDDTILIQGNADLIHGKVIPRIYTKEITKNSEPNDIIMTVRAPVGDLAINNYYACIGRGVCSIKGDTFVYYLLEFVKGKNTWNKYSQGTTFEAISSSDVKSLKVSIPSSQEQNKIASFLSKVDEKIGKLEEKQQLWETYKKGIMQQIFNQKLRFKDENGEDYPEWEEKDFGQIFHFISTNSFSREKMNGGPGKIRNIHYGDIHTRFPSILDFESVEVPFINDDVDLSRMKPENYCQNGDLVIADASEDYEDIGKAVELKNVNNKKVLGGLHTLLARDETGLSQEGYKGYMMLDNNVKIQMKKLATGISVLGISKGNLGKVKINLPTPAEQNKIANFLSAIDEKIKEVNKELELNTEFKKGLLQKMFC